MRRKAPSGFLSEQGPGPTHVWLLAHALDLPSGYANALALAAGSGMHVHVVLVQLAEEAPDREDGPGSCLAALQSLARQHPQHTSVQVLAQDPAHYLRLRHAWMRAAGLAPILPARLRFPSPLGPDLPSELPLAACCEVLPCCDALQPCWTCPCHAAALPQAQHESDACRTATWRCPVTGAALCPSDCQPDRSTLQLARGTMLRFLPAHTPVVAAALRAAAGDTVTSEPPVLEVVERVSQSSLTEGLLFGRPITLRTRGGPVVAEEEVHASLVASIVQLLGDGKEALLARCPVDLALGRPAPWPLLYVLLPDAAHGTLLAKRLAGAEEALPEDLAASLVAPPSEPLTAQLRASLAAGLPTRTFSIARVSSGVHGAMSAILRAGQLVKARLPPAAPLAGHALPAAPPGPYGAPVGPPARAPALFQAGYRRPALGQQQGLPPRQQP